MKRGDTDASCIFRPTLAHTHRERRVSERRGLYVWMQHTRCDFAGEGNQDQEESE